MRTHFLLRSLSCGLTATLGIVPLAHADSAAAEVLFREGHRLLVEGRTAEACAKLSESERLDPSSGTLMNLAYCHQKLGRAASAWAEFLEAQRLAIAQHNPERAAEAKTRAAALEPQLSRLIIRVANLVPNLTISRNSDVLAPSTLGVPLPVDQGHYEIRLSAPGFNDWHTEIDIDQPGERVVEAPALEPQKSAAPTAAPSAPKKPPPRKSSASSGAPKPMHRPPSSTHKSLPPSFWIAGGVAVAAAGFATTTGILSLSSYRRAEDACPNHDECASAKGIDAWNTTRRQATMTDVGFITAAAAAIVAGYVYFSTPSTTRSAARSALFVW